MVSKLGHYSTKLNADCIKWCPYNSDIFVDTHDETNISSEDFEIANSETGDHSSCSLLACSTYELNNSSGVREGGLDLLKLSKNSTLDQISTIDCSGVFRFQWIRFSSYPSILAALTNGKLAVFTCSPKDFQLSLHLSIPVSEDSLLTCLCPIPVPQTSVSSSSVSALANENNQRFSSVICGDSGGRVSVVDMSTETVSVSWEGHNLHGSGTEIWSVLADSRNQNIVYTGADDSCLKIWDLRDVSRPSISNKSHSAGVTSLISANCVSGSAAGVHIVSGSYDECLRLWDVRIMCRSLNRMEAVGGGVWDLDWEPTQSVQSDPEEQSLAVACMYGGWKVVNLTSNAEWKDPGVGLKENEERLLYGVSWNRENTDILATCSFYDRSVEVFLAS